MWLTEILIAAIAAAAEKARIEAGIPLIEEQVKEDARSLRARKNAQVLRFPHHSANFGLPHSKRT